MYKYPRRPLVAGCIIGHVTNRTLAKLNDKTTHEHV